MAVDTGMTKAEMKKLLNRSKEEPVSCAIGLGDDAGVGLLLLHRTKPGRAVEALLKEAVPSAKNTRWGTAFVDLEDNPKLVKLTLNKAVSGMARKLVKTLKGTGFTKVVILSEDGSAMDDYEEADQDAPEAGTAAAAVPAAPTLPAAAVPAAPTLPAAGPTAEDKAAQAAALTRALAGLVPGIAAAAGGDPARKAVLDKLARDAGVNLKTGNPTYAANFIAQLKAALAGGGAPTVDASAAASRAAWTGLRSRVETDLGSLRQALATTYADAPAAAEIASRFQAKAGPLLARFDMRLAGALDALAAEADVERRAPLRAAASALVDEYSAFAEGDAFLADLDDNPFVPLELRAAARGALAEVARGLAV